MMREAHRPRGNPLFDDLDASFDTGSEDPGSRSDDSDERGETSGASQEGFSRTRRTRRPPPTSSWGSASANPLVDALMEAGPETAEHLLRAMEELLLAAQTVVQAAERGVGEQRGASGQRGASEQRESGDERADAPAADASSGGAATGGFSSIDLT